MKLKLNSLKPKKWLHLNLFFWQGEDVFGYKTLSTVRLTMLTDGAYLHEKLGEYYLRIQYIRDREGEDKTQFVSRKELISKSGMRRLRKGALKPVHWGIYNTSTWKEPLNADLELDRARSRLIDNTHSLTTQEILARSMNFRYKTNVRAF